MHVAVAICYGLTIWFAMLLFTLAAGEHSWTVFFAGPLIVSGAVIFISGLDWLVWRLFERREPAQDSQPAK